MIHKDRYGTPLTNHRVQHEESRWRCPACGCLTFTRQGETCFTFGCGFVRADASEVEMEEQGQGSLFGGAA